MKKPKAMKSPPPSNAGVPLDTVTVLATQQGYLATKVIARDPATGESVFRPYNAGTFFGVLPPFGVSNIQELSNLLAGIEYLPQLLVIRGSPGPGVEAGQTVQRRGSGSGSQFVGNFMTPPEGRRYVLIDFDKISLPQGQILSPLTVGDVTEHLVGLLPKEFHDASYHWQLSSSAGFCTPDKVSMHIWFWLARPVSDNDLKRWGEHANSCTGMKLVDLALFQHVQPHYTAAPVFEGVNDPFPARSGLVEKAKASVDLVLPPPVVKSPAARKGTVARVPAHGGAGFKHHLSRIGDHTGGDGFHEPLRDAAASFVAQNGREGTDRERLYEILHEAVLAADANRHSPSEVQQRGSREHILPLIDSAMTKFGDAPPSGRKSRLHTGIKPHFQSNPMSVEAVQAELLNMLPSARSSNVRFSDQGARRVR